MEDVEIRKPDLEDVFIDVMGGERAQPPAAPAPEVSPGAVREADTLTEDSRL